MLHRIVGTSWSGRSRVTLVHGFTQTLASWDEVAAWLDKAGVEVVQVDLPGHGGSAGLRLGFGETALALGGAGGRGCYAGYSMGGRLCLRLALERPDLVSSLVLIGASPGLADAADRAARRDADGRLADDVLEAGTADFLERWLAQPLLQMTQPPESDLIARRTNPPEGLSYALRELGTGRQEPLWDRLGELAMPVLLVVGEHDGKFRAIAERMAGAIGERATLAVVEGAGHAVPLDRPAACARLIADHALHDATR
ncbi:MAG: alpha/beta fold hydrolase [Actinomycetota bacterium]|nr:alpha/beta fold hydrolase [Actinomycetota bacterium]